MDRLRRAEDLWDEGSAHEAAQRWQKAWRCYEDAHDLVLDNPVLHLKAHHRLLPINRALGNRDAVTDRFLIALAPVGIFVLITMLSRLRGFLLRKPMYVD